LLLSFLGRLGRGRVPKMRKKRKEPHGRIQTKNSKEGKENIHERNAGRRKKGFLLIEKRDAKPNKESATVEDTFIRNKSHGDVPRCKTDQMKHI